MDRVKRMAREYDENEAMGIPRVQPVEFATEEDRAAWDAKLKNAGQEARRAELQDLVSKYERASDLERMNRIGTGIEARSMSLSNPAAADMILKTQTPIDTAPTRKIIESQKIRGEDIDQTKGIQGNVLTDQEMDPNSNVSSLYRKMLGDNGIQVPDNVSAADLKRVFPFLKMDTTLDADAAKAAAERKRKEQHDVLTEAGKDKRTQMMVQGGIDKAVISGAIGQNERSGGGSGGGNAASAARIATGLTTNYPANIFGEEANDGKFLVRRRGLPSDPALLKRVNDLNIEGSRYSVALNGLEELLSDASRGLLNANIFDSNWPEIQRAFQSAISTNIKYRGNGVANGPDIEQAVKEIGDLNGVQDFVRGGGLRKVRAAIQSISDDLHGVYKTAGLELSDSPHPNDGSSASGGGSSGGSGGSRSGPVFDVSGAASDAFKRRGLTSPVKNKGQTPQAKPQSAAPAEQPKTDDMVSFVLPDGKIKVISRKSATVLQAARRGRIQ